MVRVQKNGRRRDIGLGGYPKLSLAKARERASEVRAQVEDGLDPVAERRKASGLPTFKAAAKLVFEEHSKAWRNGKHASQWLNTLETYVYPVPC